MYTVWSLLRVHHIHEKFHKVQQRRINSTFVTGAYLVVYKTAKLFKPVGKDEKITVISDLHFSGIEVTDAEEEIKLAFEELQAWTVNESQVIQCVFWNGSFWDDYGCRYDSTVKACFCNHATPFTSILVGTMRYTFNLVWQSNYCIYYVKLNGITRWGIRYYLCNRCMPPCWCDFKIFGGL